MMAANGQISPDIEDRFGFCFGVALCLGWGLTIGCSGNNVALAEAIDWDAA